MRSQRLRVLGVALACALLVALPARADVGALAAEAQRLAARWGRAPADETSHWLARHAGDWPAEALRSEWLRHLARRGDSARFMADWVPQQDAALVCQWLQVRARVDGTDTAWFRDAAEVWAVGSSRPPDCDPVFERLQASPAFDDALHWRRLTDAVARGNILGVQFHPESVLTPEGPHLLANFLRLAGEGEASRLDAAAGSFATRGLAEAPRLSALPAPTTVSGGASALAGIAGGSAGAPAAGAPAPAPATGAAR